VGKLRTIAANAFREVIHQRVTYSVIVLAILLALASLAPMASVHMASEAGETQVAERMSAGLLSQLLGFWRFAAMLMGVSLGARAVSEEVRSKTIVTVLARPVTRTEFLFGKFLGIQTFIAAVVALGIVGGCAMAWNFGISLPLLFWFAAAEMFVDALLPCAVSIALGAFIPRGVAMIAALCLRSMGSFAKLFMNASFGVIASAIYYLSPAAMPIGLLDASFGKHLLEPQYGLYAAVLTENLLYTGAVILLAALLLSHREVKLG